MFRAFQDFEKWSGGVLPLLSLQTLEKSKRGGQGTAVSDIRNSFTSPKSPKIEGLGTAITANRSTQSS
jgi:hypothetical protein